MISIHLICVMWPNYPRSNVVADRSFCKVQKEKRKLITMRSCSPENLECDHFTSGCFSEDDKEMYQNLKRTCRGSVLLTF